MAKTFYTERDIEDLAATGARALNLDDTIVLTDLARDKALALGIRLERGAPNSNLTPPPARPSTQTELVAKVKAAVIARLGPGVDPAMLESVITRVIAQIK